MFCFNGGSDNATAIDAATGQVLGNIALGGRPELPQADGKGRVFVNLEDSSAVVTFDAKTLAMLSRWPLGPGEEPAGLAYDAKHGCLFSACANKTLVVLDATTGRVVATEPIGDGPDGCALDAERGLVFTSNGEGTLALDPRTHRIYLAAAR